MLLDFRLKKVPAGYAGHVPCRNEVFGMSEGRALKLSMDAYDLNQTRLTGLKGSKTVGSKVSYAGKACDEKTAEDPYQSRNQYPKEGLPRS